MLGRFALFGVFWVLFFVIGNMLVDFLRDVYFVSFLCLKSGCLLL